MIPDEGRDCSISLAEQNARVNWNMNSAEDARAKGAERMPDVRRMEAALQFATRVHAAQFRKGTNIPYLAHLLAVCSLVMENGGSEDQAVAALLHDTIEDQAESFGGAQALRDEIQRQFGDAVLKIVEACTDTDVTPKPPWSDRKKAYVAHLREVDEAALLVSVADKLHNARSILADLQRDGDAVFARFKGGKDGTLWYYDALAKAFHARASGWIYDELSRVVAQMNRESGT